MIPEATYVDEVSGRQKWDKGYFAAKAISSENSGNVPPPIERKALQYRKKAIDLEKDIGKQKLITSQTARQEQGGFWCETCKCLMKDSQSYLDHINGKKHNRQLGMTMRVERIESSDVIRQKLKSIRVSQIEQEEKKSLVTDVEGVKLKIKKLLDYEEDKKQRRKEKKKLKKKERKKQKVEEIPEESEMLDSDQIFAMMNQSSIPVSSDPVIDEPQASEILA